MIELSPLSSLPAFATAASAASFLCFFFSLRRSFLCFFRGLGASPSSTTASSSISSSDDGDGASTDPRRARNDLEAEVLVAQLLVVVAPPELRGRRVASAVFVVQIRVAPGPRLPALGHRRLRRRWRRCRGGSGEEEQP
jgi:hypothetical protein